MELDLASLTILGLCLFGPATVILIVFMVLQKRRSRFHRQRITKGQSKRGG